MNKRGIWMKIYSSFFFKQERLMKIHIFCYYSTLQTATFCNSLAFIKYLLHVQIRDNNF